jgi:hypothetical protein
MFRFPWNFVRQFLFDEFVAIFHRYDLKRVSLKSWITVLSSYVKTELFSHVYNSHDSLLNFHCDFLNTLYKVGMLFYILWAVNVKLKMLRKTFLNVHIVIGINLFLSITLQLITRSLKWTKFKSYGSSWKKLLSFFWAFSIKH